jgi:hypothetical protein
MDAHKLTMVQINIQYDDSLNPMHEVSYEKDE